MSQIDRQRARAEALNKRRVLAEDIDRCGATAEQKAFLHQHLEHLWRYADQAMGGVECRP
jgi:hypothetical protein